MRKVAAVAALAGLGVLSCSGARQERIVIGSKNFTEQVILGEILATLIETRTGLLADRRFDLGGTFVCHKALVAGELDLYVEYTGTALSAILEAPAMPDPEAVLGKVREEYARRFDLVWLPPLGFNNTFALVVRPDDAARHALSRISDLARVRDGFRPGFGYEFIERGDGYKGLAAAYGFEFRERPREMDLGLIYRALAERQVDVVAGSSTDGLIDSLGLVVLEDDRRYFPPYDAAPVVRAAALEAHPELRPLLEQLAGRISEQQMRKMNHAVDGKRRSPRSVAREFLEKEGLLAGRLGELRILLRTDGGDTVAAVPESRLRSVTRRRRRTKGTALSGGAAELIRLPNYSLSKPPPCRLRVQEGCCGPPTSAAARARLRHGQGGRDLRGRQATLQGTPTVRKVGRGTRKVSGHHHGGA